MNMFKLLKLLLVCIVLSLSSCSPTKTPTANSGASNAINLGNGSTNTSTSSGGNKTTGSSNTTSTTIGRGGPNFQTADTSGINTSTGQKLVLKPASDASKVFLVQRITNYRPIWLDLTKPLGDSNGFWNFMTKVSTAVDSSAIGGFTKSTFQLNQGSPTANVSIHQVLTAFAETNDLVTRSERGDNFKTIGHTLSTSLTFPTLPTAVVSLYAIASSDPLSQSMVPPTSYQTVYSRLGPLTTDILAACQREQKASAAGTSPAQDDITTCNEVTAGGQNIYDYTNVQMQGSTTTGVGDLSNFYTMQTLVIWQGNPQPGYQCLGQIVTNTSEQPATAQDAGGMYAQNMKTLTTDPQTGTLTETYDWDYPLYCIAQKYLVPGMLVPVATNGASTPATGVDFYAIAPDPKYPKGLANMNLFYAVPSSMTDTDRAKIQVWVLNTDYLKLLPDLSASGATKQ